MLKPFVCRILDCEGRVIEEYTAPAHNHAEALTDALLNKKVRNGALASEIWLGSERLAQMRCRSEG